MKSLRYIKNEYPDFEAGFKTFNESAFMEQLKKEHGKSTIYFNF